MFLMLPQFEESLISYFLLWIEMIRPSMKKWYILFTSKVICIQELNTFFWGGDDKQTRLGSFSYVGNNNQNPQKHIIPPFFPLETCFFNNLFSPQIYWINAFCCFALTVTSSVSFNPQVYLTKEIRASIWIILPHGS